jgi:hypothetical protein
MMQHTGWRVCPDCGWDFDKHGDTHKWRFHCARAERETVGVGQYPPTESNHTLPPLSGADANAMMLRIVDIMEQRELTLPQAINAYIVERTATSEAQNEVSVL